VLRLRFHSNALNHATVITLDCLLVNLFNVVHPVSAGCTRSEILGNVGAELLTKSMSLYPTKKLILLTVSWHAKSVKLVSESNVGKPQWNGCFAGISSSRHSGRTRSIMSMASCCSCFSFWLLSPSASPLSAHTSCWMPKTIDGLSEYLTVVCQLHFEFF